MRDVFQLAAAVLIAGISQIAEPFSRLWWAGMLSASALAIYSGLHIAWNKLPKSAQEVAVRSVWRPTGYLRPWIGWTVAVAVVGGAFAWSHGYLKFESPFAARKAPVSAQKPIEKPPPAPPPPPSPPPKPWVTSEEIEAQKKLGRTLLVYRPDELIAMEANGESINIFTDKWVKLDYEISAGPGTDTIQKKQYYVLEMLVDVRSYTVFGLIAAYFDPRKYGDAILALRKKDHLKAYCQMMGVTQGKPFNSYGTRYDMMSAYNCDLI